jgi:hypothetical protein
LTLYEEINRLLDYELWTTGKLVAMWRVQVVTSALAGRERGVEGVNSIEIIFRKRTTLFEVISFGPNHPLPSAITHLPYLSPSFFLSLCISEVYAS